MANLKVAEVVVNERSVSSVETGSLNLLRFSLSLNISSNISIKICIFLCLNKSARIYKVPFELTACPDLKQ